MGEKINKCIFCGRCLGDLLDPAQQFEVHCAVNEKYIRA